jgi:hypothetical protein
VAEAGKVQQEKKAGAAAAATPEVEAKPVKRGWFGFGR